MILGTVVGVAQTNLKRMLAYSSIAHGGYLLRRPGRGERRRQGGDPVLPAGLRGHQPRRLRRHRAARRARPRATTSCATTPASGTRIPALAALMTVCLLSLGGLPPTAGFIGKWYIFSAAVSAGYYGLADHRRADERHLGVLLPARRRDDVHAGARRRGAAAST